MGSLSNGIDAISTFVSLLLAIAPGLLTGSL